MLFPALPHCLLQQQSHHLGPGDIGLPGTPIHLPPKNDRQSKCDHGVTASDCSTTSLFWCRHVLPIHFHRWPFDEIHWAFPDGVNGSQT